MDNLKYSPAYYLHNVISAEDIIVKNASLMYLDQGHKFKETETSLVVDKTFLGHGSSQFIMINKYGQAENGVPLELNFSVTIEEKEPGIGNDNPRVNLGSRPVSGLVYNPVITSGVIDDNTVELMLDSMLSSIKVDSKLTESAFYNGRKGYYVSLSAINAVIKINGVNTTPSIAATAISIADKINLVSGILAVPVSNTVVFITTVSNATTLLVEAGANTAILKRGLFISSTSAESKAKVLASYSSFEVYVQSLLSIDYTNVSVSGDGGITLISNNSDYTTTTFHTANTTAAAAATAINGSSSVNNTVVAYAIGTVVYIAGKYLSLNTLQKITTDIQSTVKFIWNCNGFGTFSSNTAKDLDRRFIGRYAGENYAIQQKRPYPNEEYVILRFTIKGTSSVLSGSANGTEGFYTKVNLVIKKDLFFDSVKWSLDMSGAGTSKYLSDVINEVYAGTII